MNNRIEDHGKVWVCWVVQASNDKWWLQLCTDHDEWVSLRPEFETRDAAIHYANYRGMSVIVSTPATNGSA